MQFLQFNHAARNGMYIHATSAVILVYQLGSHIDAAACAYSPKGSLLVLVLTYLPFYLIFRNIIFFFGLLLLLITLE